MNRKGDLAVGPLARGPVVLTLDADGEQALLGKAGVVDDEDRLGVGEGLGHDRPITLPDGLLIFRSIPSLLLESKSVFDETIEVNEAQFKAFE